MYEKEATLLVKALEARVAGKASASKGPGPAVTVRYRVEGTTLDLHIVFAAGKIAVHASSEPEGPVLWGVREHPISSTGIAQAVAEMTEWARQGSSPTGGPPAGSAEREKA
jgi:hypothetical protein